MTSVINQLADNLSEACDKIVKLETKIAKMQSGIDEAYGIVELSPDRETSYTQKESKRLADDCIEVYHILEELRSKP